MSKLFWETNLDIASLGLPDFETDQELAHEHISHLSASSKACLGLELMGWKGALTKRDTVLNSHQNEHVRIDIMHCKEKRYLEMVWFSVIC